MGHSDRIPIIHAPLLTDRVTDLQALWESGFTWRAFPILLRAILLNKRDIAEYLCQQLGISFNGIAALSAESTPTATWELLEYAAFYKIIEGVVTEFLAFYWNAEVRQFSETYPLNIHSTVKAILAFLIPIETRIAKYIVRVLQWKYSLPADKAAHLAIDTLENYGRHLQKYLKFMGLEDAVLGSEDLVLELLLQCGPNPNEINYWQTALWTNILRYGQFETGVPRIPGLFSDITKVLPTIKVFLKSGAAVDRKLWLDARKICEPLIARLSEEEQIKKREMYNLIKGAETPLEIAFLLRSSAIFCFLVAELDDLSREKFCRWISSKCPNIPPEFIQALKTQDVELLATRWNTRIQNLPPLINAIGVLNSRGPDAFKEVVLQQKDHSQLADITLQIADIAVDAPPDALVSPTYNKSLEFLLEKGATLEAIKDSNWKRRRNEYLMCLMISINSNNLELLDILLRFGIQNRAGFAATHVASWLREVYLTLLIIATRGSLSIFKLITDGLDPALDPAQKNTYLYHAVEAGNLSIATYILRRGSCRDELVRALRAAVDMGRIDMISLILGHYPDYHQIALEEVEGEQFGQPLSKVSNARGLDFLRNWKPGHLNNEVSV
ncbi:hypothetical protein TWF718_005081 [Orbilia javanica]|uniref:Uncharacterized protein n=1 Tax=Orbilia javanica TaxID=47235 RepID=A0AAN8P0E8_9PEZI